MPPIGYQLYSSRNFPPMTDTMTMLAKLGYAQVEGYGALFSNPDDLAELRRGLDASGLTMPTAHIGLDLIKADPAGVVEMAGQLGLKAAFVPFLQPDDRPTTAQGWKDLGQTVEEAAKPLQDAGLEVGWHNHDFEFIDVEGETPFDMLMQGGESLKAELDVAWVQVGGKDPRAVVAQYADRLLSTHVKDIAPNGTCQDEDGWADVGKGVMDWSALIADLRGTSNVYLIAEHDNPSDHARFAETSFNAIRDMSEATA